MKRGKLCIPEDERVFVTLAIAEHYLVELCHNIASAFVHQIQGCFLIGFGELVSIRELVKSFAINPA